MCGKFSQFLSWGEVLDFSQPLLPAPGETPVTVTPMRRAHVLTLDSEGRPCCREMIWGFVEDGSPRHIHARAETLDRRPTFREAFNQARGVIIVASFNEADEPRPGRIRQWVIAPEDGGALAIAVVFRKQEIFQGVDLGFVQVTTRASPLISRVSDRMPAVLRSEDIRAWLGESAGAPVDRLSLLQPYESADGWSLTPESEAGALRSASVDRQLSLF